MSFKIYHFPRCKTSRDGLKLLQENGIEPEIIRYRKNPLNQSEIKNLLQKLDMKAEELVRKKDKVYKQEFKDKTLSESEWIEAMANHPSLIERPVVVNNDKAVLGRPTEKIAELLNN